MQPVALFTRSDTPYRELGVDYYDKDRDARTYLGTEPVIAHPPCRSWCKAKAFAKPHDGEQSLALLAVAIVRSNGGVVEHPEGSALWPAMNLPPPGAAADRFGGWSMWVDQYWWGHRANKPTLLYIVGCRPDQLPAFPIRLGDADRVLFNRRGLRSGMEGFRTEVTRAERERSPIGFATWLVELASRCAK